MRAAAVCEGRCTAPASRTMVLLQEGEELRGGAVVAEAGGGRGLVLQHSRHELAAEAGALAGLVDVEVEDAQRRRLLQGSGVLIAVAEDEAASAAAAAGGGGHRGGLRCGERLIRKAWTAIRAMALTTRMKRFLRPTFRSPRSLVVPELKDAAR